MRRTWMVGFLLLSSCARDDFDPDTIVRLERAALDRWGKGDPQGYLGIYAPEITYFDPSQPRRVDGIDAMKTLYAPIAGKIKVNRYEMSKVKVQRSGDTAVLSYNLVSYVKPAQGAEFQVRWNCTEVYRRAGQDWRIVHNHWSYIQPELKNPINEPSAN